MTDQVQSKILDRKFRKLFDCWEAMINDSVASDNCRYGSRITDKDGIETQTLDYSTPSTDFFINNA